MFKKVISLFILFIALHHVVNASKRHLVNKRASLSTSEIFCITRYIDARINNDEDCQNVVSDISSLYTSEDVELSISTGLSSFLDFCRPECGQVILDAWKSCDAYEEIEPVANLLIGMCASNGGSTCYSTFNELFSLLDSGIDCYEDLSSSGECSSQCSAGARDGVQNYGCCVKVVIDYENEVINRENEDEEDNVEDEFNILFFECGVTGPARCTNSPLMIPDLTTQPTSATTQPPTSATTQQPTSATTERPTSSTTERPTSTTDSAASPIATVMTIAMVCFAAVLM